MGSFLIKDIEKELFFVGFTLHFGDVDCGVRYYHSSTCDLGPKHVAKEMNESEARATKALLENDFPKKKWEVVLARDIAA